MYHEQAKKVSGKRTRVKKNGKTKQSDENDISLQQIGRRPNMNTNLMRPGNSGHNGSLDTSPNPMPWPTQQQQQQMRQKAAEDILSQHHHHHQQQQQQHHQRAMPLSPPLTPLPPRFMPPVQPPHLLPHSPPFAAAANLLFAAQQYNPFLRGPAPAALPQPLPAAPMEVFENLQRLFQLRQAELNGGFGFRPNLKPETDELVSH